MLATISLQVGPMHRLGLPHSVQPAVQEGEERWPRACQVDASYSLDCMPRTSAVQPHIKSLALLSSCVEPVRQDTKQSKVAVHVHVTGICHVMVSLLPSRKQWKKYAVVPSHSLCLAPKLTGPASVPCGRETES